MPSSEVRTDAVDAPLRLDRPAAGLVYRVARDIEEVSTAWRMVYMAYRRGGLIEPNPHRMHTAPQAVGGHAAVIAGYIGPLCCSTLTAFADNPAGLPLDRVYGAELQALRAEGRVLMEVGLFADRRKQLSRTAEALFQLMRYAFYYGLRSRITDFVIGVHPRHARFYTRAFGFETLGQAKSYPAVNNRPVVLLRGDLDSKLKLRPLHPALEYFVANPIDDGQFCQRYNFDPHEIESSSIGAFLRDREHYANLGQTA
jgi:hypothetical protein